MRLFRASLITASTFIFTLFFAAQVTQAASLNFLVQPATTAPEEIVTVRLLLSSETPVNAIAATVLYPADAMRLVSTSRVGSLVTYWIQEPATTIGSVTFEGIITNSFSGERGKIIDLVFKSSRPGSFPVTLQSAQVLAADGYGTNLLSSAGTAIIAVSGSGQSSPAKDGQREAPQSSALRISSITHPRERRWYSSNTPVLEWALPTGARGSSYSVTRAPADPGTRITTTLGRVQLEPLADGEYVFNVRAQTASGGWSDTSHYTFRIDSTPPDPFAVTFPHGPDSDDPRPVTLFNTKDAASGIAYYEVVVNNAEADRVEGAQVVASNPYVLPTQGPGEHLVLVRAFDSAGNVRVAQAGFQIGQLPPPTLHVFDDVVPISEPIRISGKSEPLGIVTIKLSQKGQSIFIHEVTADATGQFASSLEHTLLPGEYALAARVLTSQGAQSQFSAPISVSIGDGGSFSGIFASMRRLLLPIAITLLLALSLLRLFFERKTIIRMREQIHSMLRGGGRMQKTETSVAILIKEIQTLEAAMITRQLTKEEHAILTELRLELSRLANNAATR